MPIKKIDITSGISPEAENIAVVPPSVNQLENVGIDKNILTVLNSIPEQIKENVFSFYEIDGKKYYILLENNKYYLYLNDIRIIEIPVFPNIQKIKTVYNDTNRENSVSLFEENQYFFITLSGLYSKDYLSDQQTLIAIPDSNSIATWKTSLNISYYFIVERILADSFYILVINKNNPGVDLDIKLFYVNLAVAPVIKSVLPDIFQNATARVNKTNAIYHYSRFSKMFFVFEIQGGNVKAGRFRLYLGNIISSIKLDTLLIRLKIEFRDSEIIFYKDNTYFAYYIKNATFDSRDRIEFHYAKFETTVTGVTNINDVYFRVYDYKAKPRRKFYSFIDETNEVRNLFFHDNIYDVNLFQTSSNADTPNIVVPPLDANEMNFYDFKLVRYFKNDYAFLTLKNQYEGIPFFRAELSSFEERIIFKKDNNTMLFFYENRTEILKINQTPNNFSVISDRKNVYISSGDVVLVLDTVKNFLIPVNISYFIKNKNNAQIYYFGRIPTGNTINLILRYKYNADLIKSFSTNFLEQYNDVTYNPLPEDPPSSFKEYDTTSASKKYYEVIYGFDNQFFELAIFATRSASDKSLQEISFAIYPNFKDRKPDSFFDSLSINFGLTNLYISYPFLNSLLVVLEDEKKNVYFLRDGVSITSNFNGNPYVLEFDAEVLDIRGILSYVYVWTKNGIYVSQFSYGRGFETYSIIYNQVLSNYFPDSSVVIEKDVFFTLDFGLYIISFGGNLSKFAELPNLFKNALCKKLLYNDKYNIIYFFMDNYNIILFYRKFSFFTKVSPFFHNSLSFFRNIIYFLVDDKLFELDLYKYQQKSSFKLQTGFYSPVNLKDNNILKSFINDCYIALKQISKETKINFCSIDETLNIYNSSEILVKPFVDLQYFKAPLTNKSNAKISFYFESDQIESGSQIIEINFDEKQPELFEIGTKNQFIPVQREFAHVPYPLDYLSLTNKGLQWLDLITRKYADYVVAKKDKDENLIFYIRAFNIKILRDYFIPELINIYEPRFLNFYYRYNYLGLIKNALGGQRPEKYLENCLFQEGIPADNFGKIRLLPFGSPALSNSDSKLYFVSDWHVVLSDLDTKFLYVQIKDDDFIKQNIFNALEKYIDPDEIFIFFDRIL